MSRGIYIAGELGGMGLIRKACDQGRQAIEAIAKSRHAGDAFDVVIVGAGPAGIAGTLTAMQHKLKFLTIEQESGLGGTVYHYPRNKVVMTDPVRLPLAGLVQLKRALKEELLAHAAERVGVAHYGAERQESGEAKAERVVREAPCPLVVVRPPVDHGD